MAKQKRDKIIKAKAIAALLSLSALSTGCRVPASPNDSKIIYNPPFREYCFKGVLYVSHTAALTVEYTQQGTIATCEIK